jgi:exopolysaccharide biosynthesis polyprenyl glycosylphosphotransferase
VPAHVFRLNRSATSDSRFATDGYLHYRVGVARRWEERIKRLFDIVAGSIALTLLAPLFLVVAILVKGTSRGPVFFRQNRVGRHGRPFQMLKFRSMVVNAEQLQAKLQQQNEQTGPVFKMRSDPRITRVGRFIRRYSIDELPQFWNVVRGDMSIVGPRPPLPSEVVQYDAWQRRRLSMRPGLTCLWQTQGRNRIGFEQWMYLDLQYVDQWSVLSDLQLVARTIPAVISGDGAS